MWNWYHLKGEGWLRHSMRAAQMSGLLLLSGAAMLLHILVPFWQQPEFLRVERVADSLKAQMVKHRGEQNEKLFASWEPKTEAVEETDESDSDVPTLTPRQRLRKALRENKE
jgi:hypothetical protein